MKLKLCKSDWLGDWFTIERAEHENKRWFEDVPGMTNARAFQHSGRISDADVEGTLAEMVALAEAIETKGSKGFKRCAVDARQEPVKFWSPRNTMERMGEVSYEDALDLARQIREPAALPHPQGQEGEG